MNPLQVILTLMIMLILPVTGGMLLRAKRPNTVIHIRKAVRLSAGIIFAGIIAMIIGSNIKSLILLAQTALLPVIFTFTIALGLGWSLGKLTGLLAADRRALTIEVAFQNVALAIGLGIAFFPSLAGIVAVSILWGIVHLTLGTGIAFVWSQIQVN